MRTCSSELERSARPWEYGCPFEAYPGAGDESWCVVLCQRDKPGDPLRIIAFICKTFSDEATRWSALEREFYRFKEGYAAIAKHVIGFKFFMFSATRTLSALKLV